MHSQKDGKPVVGVTIDFGEPGRYYRIASWQNAVITYFMDKHHSVWSEPHAVVSEKYLFQNRSFAVTYELKSSPSQMVEVVCHSKTDNGPSTFIITVVNGADTKRYRASLESGSFNILGLASPQD